MLLAIVILAVMLIAALLTGFARLIDAIDKWLFFGLFVVSVAFAAPAHAAGDDNWPSIQQQTVPIAMAHNVYGDRIVLFANFCEGPRSDHMHTYGIYNRNGMFLSGGCWKYDQLTIRRTRLVQYFSMSAGGWNEWPRGAFTSVKALDVQCRGNSGDDPNTQLACQLRDSLK